MVPWAGLWTGGACTQLGLDNLLTPVHQTCFPESVRAIEKGYLNGTGLSVNSAQPTTAVLRLQALPGLNWQDQETRWFRPKRKSLAPIR